MVPTTVPAQGMKASHPAQIETIPRQGLDCSLRLSSPLLFTCQTAVDELDKRPLAPPEYLGGDEDGEAAPDTAKESVDHSPGHHLPVLRPGDLSLRAAIECEEAKYENEGSETDEGDGVSRHGKILSPRSEPANPGPEHDGAHQCAGPPGKVDHAGAREVVKFPGDTKYFVSQ